MNKNSDQIWSSYTEVYDALKTLTPYQKMFDDIITILQGIGAHTILDAACGTGNLLHYAQDKLPHSTQFTNVDSESRMLDQAQKKSGTFSNASFHCIDLNAPLPFDDESFDVVVSSNTLYAVKNPHATLSEFKRVLQVGGSLILTNPLLHSRPELILKSHCDPNGPLDHWIKTRDLEGIFDLIRESVADSQVAENLCRVALYDTQLRTAQDHHFFEKSDLEQFIVHLPMAIYKSAYTYAKQDHLIACTRTA